MSAAPLQGDVHGEDPTTSDDRSSSAIRRTTTPPPESARPLWRRHGLKLILALILASAVTYIIVDQVTKTCDDFERERDRLARLRRAGEPVNTTGTPTNTTGARHINCGNTSTTFTFDPSDGRCHFRSACLSRALAAFVDWVSLNVVLGAFLYTLIYTVCAVFWFPGSVLTLGAGAAFSAATDLGTGVLIGTVSVWFGAFFGACLAFLLGHYVFHDLVNRLISKWRITRAIDAAIKEHGVKTMCLLRLSPVIPYNAFNYVMAGTSVSFRDYAIGCTAMLPGTIAYVYVQEGVRWWERERSVRSE